MHSRRGVEGHEAVVPYNERPREGPAVWMPKGTVHRQLKRAGTVSAILPNKLMRNSSTLLYRNSFMYSTSTASCLESGQSMVVVP